MEFNRGEYGEIKIHNEVIIAIVRRAAIEIDGVEKIASGFKKGFLSFLGHKRFSRGVILERSKEGDVKVTISIVVLFGINIPEVVNKVQVNVKKMLEQMSGIMPLEINIEVEKVVQEKDTETVIEEIQSIKNQGGCDEI
ncbi:MAG: Asp23/Gls24 family envelope stress response protein [Candidatus Saelkia tenebricola]|nr:Asp23/Gls24 family envelope stress response protein [Candidatus Saelkia tenebricola]